MNMILKILVNTALLDSAKASEYEAANLPLTANAILKYFAIDSTVFARNCAQHYNLDLYDLTQYPPKEHATNYLQKNILKNKTVLPLQIINHELVLAIADPNDLDLYNDLKFQLDCNIKIVFADVKIIQFYRHVILSQQYFVHIQKISPNNIDLESAITTFLQHLFNEALFKKGSDLHLEPTEKHYRIRLRIDGILNEVIRIDLALGEIINNRLKIMANLDIAEKRLPQDGQYRIDNAQGESTDCRISSCPVLYGEKFVIRFLNNENKNLTLAYLGMNEHEQAIFLEHIHKPQGLILVTGPTGSGKSITLYTALNILNHVSKNILTIEDPIEIKLAGISQVNVHTKIGLTFTNILRTFLRQDPDIIMVGEIRDKETAQMAIHAAQTGHLVLSTLHTNSTVESLIRLRNMGIAPYNIANTVNLIIAQRLLRTYCQHHTNFSSGRCIYCHDNYQGRVAIFELLPLTPNINHLILNNADSETLSQQAKSEGMRDLWSAGLEKLNNGITSMDELKRTLM